MSDPGATDLDLAVERLRSWCRDRGHHVDVFDRVDTSTVATLLDVEASSLRNARCLGTSPIPYIKLPSGRCRYSLADVARHLAGERFDC